MKRRVLFTFIFISALLLFVGCKSDQTILIGFSAPMTGESAKMGEDITKGVSLAVDEWNAKGGIGGKKIVAESFDDRSDPKEAVSVAQRAIAKGARGIIGHFNSSCTIPASELTNEAGLILITPASTNPKVTSRGLKLVFRTCGRDDQQGKVMATAVSKAGNTKVAILHDKTTYGQGLAEEFRKNLPPSAEVVIFEAIQRGDKDFSAILTKVKSLSPEYLMFGGLYSEAGLLVKQMRDLGLNATFVSGDGTYDPEFIRIGGAAADGALLTYAPPAEKIPSAKEFLVKSKAKYTDIGPYTIFSYDAANILLGAIAKNPKADGKALGEIIHNTIWNCASGTIEFDANGDPKNAPYVIWTVKNGKMTVD